MELGESAAAAVAARAGDESICAFGYDAYASLFCAPAADSVSAALRRLTTRISTFAHVRAEQRARPFL